ncbi:CAF17-like 4Fe-4S cluster assembly/insertion protein YgfZ [Rubinisphaera margarita]|uniref:CAF17-like 4Fe-4S cluster assembly/insertion protein YgfZ n=1 Tax=Rubinisphaera margarita TaxID=2909586 RepID=UPI001EE99E05|nr:hypothetical protein [Rubinisphaera margarita]MCG6156000.1 hypothetical protein [Rubinisphaera margarita]
MPVTIEQLQQQMSAFDLSDRDEITLRGNDRSTFLHGFCSNDIRKLQPGQGCEAFITSIKGRAAGHVFVFADEDRLVLDTVPGAAETLVPHLDRYIITEDVELEVTSQSRALFLVAGEGIVEKLSLLCPTSSKLDVNGCCEFDLASTTGRLRRVDWLSVPAYQISIRAEARGSFEEWRDAQGIAAGTHREFEALRIDGTFPLHGTDFSEENLAQEIDRTPQAISFTKGCYLGQEPIARIDALGHVNRILRSIQVIDLDATPDQLVGASIQDPSTDKSLGTITSAVEIHTGDDGHRELRGMSIIRREFSDPDTPVHVVVDGKSLPATVLGKS